MTMALVVAMALAPLSVGAAAYVWSLHREDLRTGGSRVGFSFVLAVTGTMAALVAVLLGLVAFLVIIERTDLARVFNPAVIAALLILDAIPVVNALYLRLQRGRS